MGEKFLKNQHKEQEIFLLFYFIFGAGISCFLFGLYSLMFTVTIFGISFGIYAFFSILFTKYQDNDLLFFISVCFLLFLITISIINKVYILTFIIFIAVFFSWYKKTYLPKITNDIKLEEFPRFERFLIDFSVINYHFETEFRTINLFKNMNSVATLIFIRLIIFIFSQSNSEQIIGFEIDGSWVVNLFYWLLANNLIIVLTRLLIVKSCNPPISFTTFQKILGSANAFGLGTLSFLGFHGINTSGFFEPMNLTISFEYQEHVLEYKFKNRYQAVLANTYIFANQGALPPLDKNHFVDVTLVHEALGNVGTEQIRRIIAATPYLLRPDVEVLLHGIKERVDLPPQSSCFDVETFETDVSTTKEGIQTYPAGKNVPVCIPPKD